MELSRQAETLIREGNLEAASMLCQTVFSCESAPDHSDYRIRGILYQCLGFHEKAVRDFTAILEKQPLNAELRIRRGKSFRLLKLYEGAAEDFLIANEIDPALSELSIQFKEPVDKLLPRWKEGNFMSVV